MKSNRCFICSQYLVFCDCTKESVSDYARALLILKYKLETKVKELEEVKTSILNASVKAHTERNKLKAKLDRVDEKVVWDILKTVNGCKTGGEDCSSQYCDLWGSCKRLVKAICDFIRKD